MSERGHERRSDDLAAYLLGALEPDEAAELERHLAGCEECRAELRWLRPAVELLPESVQRVEPPPQLRETADRRRSARRPRAPRAPSRARRCGSALGLRPVAGLAALVLVVAAVAGYAIGGGDSGGGDTTTVVAGKAAGRDCRGGPTTATPAPCTWPTSTSCRATRSCEAWVEREGRSSRPALFVPDRDGRARRRSPTWTGSKTVMVTAEPRGGSVRPTSTPMVSVAIPQ